ncbi:hypothetical protein [Spirosoma gilvum]
MITQSINAKVGLRVLLFLLSLLTFSACSDKKKSSQAEATSSEKVRKDTSEMQPPAAFTEQAESGKVAATQTSTWQYSNRVDKEGRTVYKASITSPKLLEFDFPYNGGSMATLTIRKREADTHVYIQVSKGQFNRSFQEGKARVRFDGSTPITYSFSAAENGSANVIFFDSEKALIKQIKAARTMFVNVDFAGQGNRQIEFRTAGLKWNN